MRHPFFETVDNDIIDVEKKLMKTFSNVPIPQDTNKTYDNKALQTIAERLDSVRETEQRTSLFDKKWIDVIITQAVNKMSSAAIRNNRS